MNRYIGKTKPATWHSGYERPPLDTPDDFTTDDDRLPGSGGVFTLLIGLGIGIILGLAWGDIWSLVTP